MYLFLLEVGSKSDLLDDYALCFFVIILMDYFFDCHCPAR
jgi:hypothetical protein